MVKLEIDLPENENIHISQADDEEKDEKKKKQKKESEESQEEDESEDEKSEKGKGDDDSESAIHKRTGFDVKELLKAPVEAAEPDAKPESEPRKGQFISISFGLFLMVVALIAWAIFNYWVAIGIAVAAATFISIGTLVRSA